MMLDSLSISEYVYWVAYFSVDWATFKPEQTPDEIQNNLMLSLAGIKKKNAT